MTMTRVTTMASNAMRAMRTSTIRAMLRKHGATETDLDRVVRVVWPGPIMKWPRPHKDVTEGEVLRGETDADRAKEKWAERRRKS